VTGACVAGTCDATLEVRYRTDVGTVSEWIRPFMEVHNTGPSSVPLSELELRYFYTFEGAGSEEVQCFYASPGGCDSLQLTFVDVSPELPGANSYLRVRFEEGAGSLSSTIGVAHFEGAFHKSPFAPYDQGNDYSFDGSKQDGYALHDKVCLYRNGVLVWGEEPSAP
jgi:mannan endo-1,4-beta-mannosidase